MLWVLLTLFVLGGLAGLSYALWEVISRNSPKEMEESKVDVIIDTTTSDKYENRPINVQSKIIHVDRYDPSVFGSECVPALEYLTGVLTFPRGEEFLAQARDIFKAHFDSLGDEVMALKAMDKKYRYSKGEAVLSIQGQESIKQSLRYLALQKVSPSRSMLDFLEFASELPLELKIPTAKHLSSLMGKTLSHVFEYNGHPTEFFVKKMVRFGIYEDVSNLKDYEEEKLLCLPIGEIRNLYKSHLNLERGKRDKKSMVTSLTSNGFDPSPILQGRKFYRVIIPKAFNWGEILSNFYAANEMVDFLSRIEGRQDINGVIERAV